MTPSLSLRQTIQLNCDISDARHNGIFSLCTLVLKLRNLFKWENRIAPGDEPDPAVILDWIAAKEAYWDTIRDTPLLPLEIDNQAVDPFDLPKINGHLSKSGLFYGAGYGRSLKPIFFLGEKKEERSEDGSPIFILGPELAQELAGPFAMLQEGTIIIRKEPLRFFLWDQLVEVRSAGKMGLKQALDIYDVLTASGGLDRSRLKAKLDWIVDQELPCFIAHEMGELREDSLESEMVQRIVGTFPDSPIEYLTRAIKDVLADTHPGGMFAFIIRGQRKTSLGLHLAFLNGLRKLLTPEIQHAGEQFWQDGDWHGLDRARGECRENNLRRAEQLLHLCRKLDTEPVDAIRAAIDRELLCPLGLSRHPPGNVQK